MLQINSIQKKYATGDLVQTALDDVSLNLRNNEFVAILGPSGSGKTTLLNIIGGLDRYDSGDLIINGISTKEYKDRNWDAYRNNTVGFIFQSYNLIPHQGILSNVELALTISGVSRVERRSRATKALEEVGLLEQIHKKPNQLSGGQMQRVAIARALVNNPDILLADEPTGALDTETSRQVMDLLKEVAKKRLVVMVTHNPELAEEYANRIVNLKDGKIVHDSNPFETDEKEITKSIKTNTKKASMSFFTSMVLSFNNLKTKKWRTLFTAFAGSIGIIGIALILALSNGVSEYIQDIQKETMTSYPITIEKRAFDLNNGNDSSSVEDITHDSDGVYSNVDDLKKQVLANSSVKENNLTELKKYMDNKDSKIHDYVGENGILYKYDIKFGVYTYDPEGEYVNTDGSTLYGSYGSSMSTNDNFQEIIPGKEGGTSISTALARSYDVLYGAWPTKFNEIVIVLNQNNEISTNTLAQLGIIPSTQYKELIEKINNKEEVTLKSEKWNFEDICKKDYYLIPTCDTYMKNENGTYKSVTSDKAQMEMLMKSAIKLKVTGVIRPIKGSTNASITAPMGYTKALTDYIINYTNKSQVVLEQKDNTNINVINRMTFSPSDPSVKINDAKKYISYQNISLKSKIYKEIVQSIYADDLQKINEISKLSESDCALALDTYLKNPNDKVMLNIYNSYISSGSYEDNMDMLGAVNFDTPSSINIYTDNFDDKDSISECIEEYNASVPEENRIIYTDYVGLLMSSVNTIINVITYVLIAFVAVSLIVSSIMIGIITFISVLERTKEIGILRAIGASKRNISQVFNAETFIIGLISGVMGIGISLVLLIPGNVIIHKLTNNDAVNGSLPVLSAIILIALSVLLTLLGGLIPSKKAAKQDPVKALRGE